MSVVSTGQITIIDSNDAKPITAFVAASGSIQQIYNPDTAPAYTPDFTTAPITLTAKVYVGSTTETAASLTSRSWATTVGGTSLGSGTTLVINSNQTPGNSSTTYYFQGIYTDPLTGASTTILAQITLGIVRTGSNATFVQVSGRTVVDRSDTATKDTAYLVASLYRGSVLDDVVTRYKWFKMLAGTYQLIHAGNTALNVVDGATYTPSQQYGFKLQSEYAATPNVESAMGANVQPSATDDAILRRGITVSERAVTDFGLFKVQVIDGSDTYESTFTIYDVSDPYDVQLVSTAGDKLANGAGATNIFPRVYNGDARVANLTGWTFIWTFRDRDGNQAAFINETQTNTATGMPVAANTAGASATITLGLTIANANLTANKVLKVVKGSNVKFYDIASVNASVPLNPIITIKTTPTSGIYTYTNPTSNEFQGGTAFICDFSVTTSGGAGETAAQINVTEYEIDVKGTIFCEANRP